MVRYPEEPHCTRVPLPSSAPLRVLRPGRERRSTRLPGRRRPWRGRGGRAVIETRELGRQARTCGAHGLPLRLSGQTIVESEVIDVIGLPVVPLHELTGASDWVLLLVLLAAAVLGTVWVGLATRVSRGRHVSTPAGQLPRAA